MSPEDPSPIKDLLMAMAPWAPAIAGGIVDYWTQMQRGVKRFSVVDVAFHLFSAAFFGWLASVGAAELDYSANVVGAAAGMGGYLGVRMADFGILFARRKVNIEEDTPA